jgi:hypothetical protein
MSNKNVFYEASKTEVTKNLETGEIVEEKESTIQKSKIKSEPHYVKVYLRDISILCDLPSGMDKLIYQLLPYMNYSNEITIVKSQKESIGKILNRSVSRINSMLSELSKKKILIKKERSVYLLNPELFGKGSWSDISKLRENINVSLTYEANGERTIKTSIGEK